MIVLALSACGGLPAAPIAPPPPVQFTLQHLGPQDQWQMLYLKEQPAGISHFTLKKTENPDTYQVESFFLLRFSLLGLPQEISLKGQELVAGNLDLISFTLEEKSPEDNLTQAGKVTGGVLYLEKEFRGKKEQRRIPLPAPLKSSLAGYYMPLLAGPEKGRSMTLATFLHESQKVEPLTVTLEDGETLNTGKYAYRIVSQAAGLTSYAWVSPSGEVLEERTLGGLLRSEKISSKEGESFILGQALAKTDLLLDFSLVAVDRKIEEPEKLKSLTLEMSGIDPKLLPPGPHQKVTSILTAPSDIVIIQMVKEPPPGSPKEKAVNLAPYLAETPLIQSEDAKIEQKAKEIVGKETDARKMAELLNLWVYGRLKKSYRESHSAREVLEVMEGECQSHAKLYAALARSLGLPAKVVNGLVYVPTTSPKGFLYHAWNEVYLDRWTAVDPTLGQFPADVTHIKLSEGESLQDIAPLAATVGKLKIKIVGEER